jgi:hypothetical protein
MKDFPGCSAETAVAAGTADAVVAAGAPQANVMPAQTRTAAKENKDSFFSIKASSTTG